MNKYLKESVFWILILLPFVYLLTIWKTLPELVPTHFDLLGNPNGWSDKNGLILLIGGMGIGTYILMLLIPKFDPKKKIEQMGDKYYSLRLLLTIFMSLLSIYILYAGNGSKINPNLVIALIGALYAILGNYFQTLKPNYFIGIRTPWTLENEQIWKKTHRLAGRLWIAGGLLTIIISFLINSNLVLVIFFGIITTIIVLVPIVFSYTEFQKTH